MDANMSEHGASEETMIEVVKNMSGRAVLFTDTDHAGTYLYAKPNTCMKGVSLSFFSQSREGEFITVGDEIEPEAFDEMVHRVHSLNQQLSDQQAI